MLHIDNLCEFLKVMIDYEESGLFFPQNEEFVRTSEMVRLIAEIHGNRIWITKLLNPIVRLMCWVGIIRKIFGNLVYEKSMSEYPHVNYRVMNFVETINATEFKKNSNE